MRRFGPAILAFLLFSGLYILKDNPRLLKKRMKKAFVLLSLLLLGALVGCANRDKEIFAKSYLNQKAPELIVEKWLTPQPDTKGKFVLVDFWATWCPPCRRAIPELNAFQKKFGDKLVVIGISDETEADVRKLKDPKIDYAIAIDTQGRTKKEIEVRGIPHVIVMDPNGIVRWEGFPFQEGFELTEKVIQDIVNPPPQHP